MNPQRRVTRHVAGCWGEAQPVTEVLVLGHDVGEPGRKDRLDRIGEYLLDAGLVLGAGDRRVRAGCRGGGRSETSTPTRRRRDGCPSRRGRREGGYARRSTAECQSFRHCCCIRPVRDDPVGVSVAGDPRCQVAPVAKRPTNPARSGSGEFELSWYSLSYTWWRTARRWAESSPGTGSCTATVSVGHSAGESS